MEIFCFNSPTKMLHASQEEEEAVALNFFVNAGAFMSYLNGLHGANQTQNKLRTKRVELADLASHFQASIS